MSDQEKDLLMDDEQDSNENSDGDSGSEDIQSEDHDVAEFEQPQIFGEEDMRDRLRDIQITDVMQKNYLSYAMSVIVARALPDVRDGLKPVHRRILYAMDNLGLRPSAKFKKSANVVGEVLGKYHPHGDAAVYEAMVRLAQDFSVRYLLVNGQGNFGSIDGDNAAAMRYTESKLHKIAEEMLADIDKDTVNFRDNYDGSQREPVVLPTRVPQILLNGGMGIAVAMATSIPPHNLTEVMDAFICLIDNPESTIDDFMQYIKGPDFPTAGIIYGSEAIKNMYATGRGGIVVRAKTRIEESKGGRYQIIVDEIPYQVNKANLISKMAELVRDKKIMQISDIRDESNREGIRVVIELQKGAYPKKILNQLFKMTALQTTFNMNMIALVDGIQPRLLNLKQILEYFLEHRKEVVRRRTEFELKKAKARAHILEGLKIALDNIDAVIETIRAAETKEIAQTDLMAKFQLTEIQAQAILEMRLQTLAGLERQKIEDELKEKLALIAELEAILADPAKILAIIREESLEIKEKYGDARRTEVVEHGVNNISSLDTIPNSPMIITLTEANYIKRMPPNTFKAQKRGGKGVKSVTTKDDDQIMGIYSAMNHDDVLFFTDRGRVFKIKVYEIPEAARVAKGQAIVNLIQLEKNERVTSVLVMKNDKDAAKFLIMGTREGKIKKTSLSEYDNVRRNGLIAIGLNESDSLEWVKPVNPSDEIVMVTNNAKCIRFDEADARPMGRKATGVRGVKLKADDFVVEMDVVSDREAAELLVVMENGLSKRSKLTEYRQQNRGGTGVLTANLTKKTGKLIGARVVMPSEASDLIVVSKTGQLIRLSVSDIPSRSRATQGVYVMRFKDDEDKVVSLSLVREIPEDLAETGEQDGESAEPEVEVMEQQTLVG